MTLSVTVAIATLGDRVFSVPSEGVPGVSRLIVVQDVPAHARAHLATLERGGAEVIVLAGRGVAKSRNAAIDRAQGDILLFGDDDVTLKPEALAQIRQRFEGRPDLSLLCGRLQDADGAPHKRYSPDGRPMRFWNIGKVGTPELAIRLGPVRRAGLRFDAGFGAGADVPLGDEFIFLADALRAGLEGVHTDIVIGQHPAESSGLRRDAAAEQMRQQVFARALGKWGALAFRAHQIRRWVSGH